MRYTRRILIALLIVLTLLLVNARLDADRTFQPHLCSTDCGVQDDSKVCIQGVCYDTADSNRPACFAEPSDTEEGVEVIKYEHLSDKQDSTRGIEVPC